MQPQGTVGIVLMALGAVWYGTLWLDTVFVRMGLSAGVPGTPDNYRTAAVREASAQRSKDVLERQRKVLRRFHPVAAVAIVVGLILLIIWA